MRSSIRWIAIVSIATLAATIASWTSSSMRM